MKKKKKEKELTLKSVINVRKKYSSKRRKILKNLKKLESRLKSSEKEFKVILSKYPLSEHRRVVRSILTHKHVSLKTTTESLNHQKNVIDEILKLLQIFLSYHDFKSPKRSKRTASQIVNENVAKFLRENIESDFRLLKKASSCSPQKYLTSLPKVRELETTSKKLMNVYTSELSKLKRYPLLKTIEEVKSDEYMHNLRKKGFEEFLTSTRRNKMEEFVKKFELKFNEVDHRKKIKKERKESYDIFNGSLRNSSIIQYELFIEAKEHYEERIYVHAIHEKSRLFNHLVDRIQHENIISNQQIITIDKTTHGPGETPFGDVKRPKIKHVINPKIFPWLDVKKDGVDRQFLSIVQNCAMNRVIKQNFLVGFVVANYELDRRFLKTCGLIQEQIEYFFDHPKLYNLELDPRFLNENSFFDLEKDEDFELLYHDKKKKRKKKFEEEEEEEEEEGEEEEEDEEVEILETHNVTKKPSLHDTKTKELKKKLSELLKVNYDNNSLLGARNKTLQQLELQENKTYQAAITTLKLLCMKYEDIFDHMEILLILGCCCSTIGMTVHRNCTLNGHKWAFGADDFFPLVAYVLVRAQVPQFITYLKYTMEHCCQENMDLYQEFSSSRSGSELLYFSTVFEAVVEFLMQIGRSFFREGHVDNEYILWLKRERESGISFNYRKSKQDEGKRIRYWIETYYLKMDYESSGMKIFFVVGKKKKELKEICETNDHIVIRVPSIFFVK